MKEMDKQLKTSIIKNFKWFNPTDNKDFSNYFLAATAKRPSSDSKAILSHHISLSRFFFSSSSFLLSFLHFFCKVYNHILMFFKPNLNLKSIHRIISGVRCPEMTNLQSLLQTVQSSSWYPEIIGNGLSIYRAKDKLEGTSQFRTLGTLKEEKCLWMLPKRL